MEAIAGLVPRIIPVATATGFDATATLNSAPPHCTAFDLPAQGIVVFNSTSTLTLLEDAVYEQPCVAFAQTDPNSTLAIVGSKEPFLASTIPQIFVLGSMLFMAWVLVFILIITPRTYFIVGSNTGGILGRRGMMGGPTGTSSVIGVGGRPWLQKAAALGVGVSLLIATINSFRVAGDQYSRGVEDARDLTNKVVGSTELQIIRTISFTFLWLAQVQTLIRLFPRHKEKVIIKWLGFALIFMDTLFAILNYFVYPKPDSSYPHSFKEAVPALAYLFQLALNFVYLCAVLAYAWAKRRFAFYHPKMRNVAIVAFLSICSIFVPVVFFVLDVVASVFIGWGDYCRWVGAAAASVVVWEWVERIEALEREERKDGILGREIFDGDDVPYSSSSIELRWPRSRKLGSTKPSNNSSGTSGDSSSSGKPGGGSTTRKFSGTTVFSRSFIFSIPFLGQDRRKDLPPSEKSQPDTQTNSRQPEQQPRTGVLGRSVGSEPVQPPPIAASPVPRADTTSAASTVYAIIHHPVGDPTPPPLAVTHETPPNLSLNSTQSSDQTASHDFSSPPNPSPLVTQRQQITRPSPAVQPPADAPVGVSRNPFSRSTLHNPFKRQRTAPPPEVTAAIDAPVVPQTFLCRKRDRLRFHRHPQTEPSELPTFTIPAREDGAAWSPEEGNGAADYMSSTGSSNTPPSSSPSNANGSNPSPASASSRVEEPRRPGTLAQMPSIDGTLNARARGPSPQSQPGASGSVISPSTQSSPSPGGSGSSSQKSTPSPRPPASSGGAGRMPTLAESHNGSEGDTQGR